jgi:putative acetyltransferase
MELSRYSSGDIDEIKQLYTEVFTDCEGQSEGITVGNLAYELMVSINTNDLYGFIATENKIIIGSILFSRLVFESNIKAFLLSPVAIHTNYQGKGIGQKLIDFSINCLKEDGVELVFTYGDPNFYSKVGFISIDENIVKAPLKLTYPEGWLGQSLVGDKIDPIKGNTYCAKPLNNPGLW